MRALPAKCILGLLAAATAAQAADIYRWVDAQGVVHYSDTPHDGAAQITVPDAQGYAAPAVQPSSAPADSGGSPPAVSQGCAITAPAAEQTLFAPQSIHISVGVTSGLRAGDQVEVSVDGARLSAAGSQTTDFDLASPDRGTHTITLTIRDASGQTVCTAAPVTFYVREPSQLSPQSPQRK